MKYKVGDLANLIASNNKGKTTNKDKKLNQFSKLMKNNTKSGVKRTNFYKKLTEVDSTKSEDDDELINDGIDVERKAIKIEAMETDSDEDDESSSEEEEECNDKVLKLYTETQDMDEDVDQHTGKVELSEIDHKDPIKTAELNKRTIFVGNVATSTKKVALTRLFKKYGQIETVRIRSVPVRHIKIPKKVAAITKDFHRDCKTLNAYVQ